MFAIVATLFGTSASLGIGAMQIGRGVEIVGGIGKLPNAALIAIIAVLTACFIASAVSGVGRGIRWLSNINMVLAQHYVAVHLHRRPDAVHPEPVARCDHGVLPELLPHARPRPRLRRGSRDVHRHLDRLLLGVVDLLVPFVGIFLAKISRGRTLREFVLYVITMPTLDLA